jgi:dTDP-4-dehydrorhamnose 3,5-epimerase
MHHDVDGHGGACRASRPGRAAVRVRPLGSVAAVKVRPLSIPGAFEVTPSQHADDRGTFLEWFSLPVFSGQAGHALSLAQANLSVSKAGTVRGIHYADVPPGQAKYVTCVAGAVRDVIVDLRVGSPTFGQWDVVLLDTVDRRAVYLSEGLGHGFCALEDGSTVAYLCSTLYNPTGEHGVDPLDPELGIDWGLDESTLLLSPKDREAPSLAEARAALPSWEACAEHVATLSTEG